MGEREGLGSRHGHRRAHVGGAKQAGHAAQLGHTRAAAHRVREMWHRRRLEQSEQGGDTLLGARPQRALEQRMMSDDQRCEARHLGRRDAGAVERRLAAGHGRHDGDAGC